MNQMETTMNDDRMALLELVEKQADGDLVREMLAFAAERIMEAEVEARTGAAKGERSPLREVVILKTEKHIPVISPIPALRDSESRDGIWDLGGPTPNIWDLEGSRQISGYPKTKPRYLGG